MIAFLIVLCAVVLLLVAYCIAHFVNRRRNRAAAIDGLLLNQRDAPVGKLRYGFFRSGYNGCGWIAAYNGCRILGEDVPPAEIISEFERYGAILFGLFGTSPSAPTHFFRKRGCRVVSTGKRERFDDLAKASTFSILWYWHSRGAHFITLRPDENGFVAYNVFSNVKRPYLLGPSVREFLEQKNYHAPRLIAVKKR